MPSAHDTYPHAPAPARGYADELEQIPVLAQDPPPSRHGRVRQATPARPIEPGPYLGLYAKYVALFVGAGLISGAIVHYPLDKTRYLMIGAVGAVLFALASTFGDARAKANGAASLLKFVAASLVLALGIGMISGGIQHFSDIPTRAATLIPLGITLSVIAFAARDGHQLFTRRMLPVGVFISAIVVWLALGLGQYASTLPTPAEGGGHHGSAATGGGGHGAAAAETEGHGSAAAEAGGHGAAAEEHAAEPAAEGDTHATSAGEHADEAAAAETATPAAAEDHSAHPH